MSGALVSVVIPCFNQAHYLRAAIESVLAQTHVPTELVVVDDGSTDDTAAVASAYKQVRLLRQTNMGLSAARNSGLDASQGEYVTFLDADDLLTENALADGVDCLAPQPKCAFAWGRYRIRDKFDAVWETSIDSHQHRDAYAALLRSNYIAMHATVLYRREVLKIVGGFDTRLVACEDYELYLRIARQFPIVKHDNVVAEYRKHGDSMSVNSPMMLVAVLRVLDEQREYIQKHSSYQAAYTEGLRFWKQFYGVRSIGRIARELYARKFGDARYDAASLFRSVGASTVLLKAPGWLVRHWLTEQGRPGSL